VQNDTIKQESPRDPTKITRQLYLNLVYPVGEQAGRSHRFVRVGSAIDVGREPPGEPAYAVPVATVSRTHFRVEASDTGWTIKDCNSSNGTSLNGNKITEAPLFEQDVVRAGSAIFVATSSPPLDLGWMGRFGVVGCSAAMGRVAETASSALKDLTNVLILGETGTGKDVVASMIHQASNRSGEFVPVNCGAIPEQLLESTLFGCLKGAFTGADADRAGLIQEAQGGTLLLDEIGELPQALQVKLLRTLEERTFRPVGATRSSPFDVKILAATNQLDAIQDPKSGFRQDLLARLEDLVIYLPPLRQRREEIVPLLLACSKEFKANTRYDPGLIEALVCYDWPRNTRQLLKTVRQVLKASSDPKQITADTLFLYLGTWPGGRKPTGEGSGATTRIDISTPRGIDYPGKARRVGPPPEVEFRKILVECKHNVSAMARHFACDRRQIYRWLEHFEIGR
jgi:transcriptional regulator with PAS, ATPase and Fis domain